jgi:hypothetical protein
MQRPSVVRQAIAFFDTLRVERSKELKRVEALNRSLDQTLLETIELRAAALRPEVQRGNEGVSELEFVICMAVELGMVRSHPVVHALSCAHYYEHSHPLVHTHRSQVEMKQLQPFLNQVRHVVSPTLTSEP